MSEHYEAYQRAGAQYAKASALAGAASLTLDPGAVRHALLGLAYDERDFATVYRVFCEAASGAWRAQPSACATSCARGSWT